MCLRFSRRAGAIFDKAGAVSAMNNHSWQEVYKSAALEVDGRKMPERISAARAAIAGRLRELEGDSDHQAERAEIEHALRALKLLTAESRDWH